MKVHHTLILGLVAGSLTMSLPAQAEPGLPPGAFVIAKRGADDSPGAERADDRRRDGRRASNRSSDDERGYGYGYERRQRGSANSSADEHRRDGEHRNERSERGDDRRDRGNRR